MSEFVVTDSSAARKLTVGVIGGMGPAATVDFMAKVIALTPADDDVDHIRMIVDNNPLLASRQAALLGNGESPGPEMAEMALGLQTSGADFLVMPCNTAHAFQACIEAAVAIPFISIIDVTVLACRDYSKPGLMATTGCLNTRLYQDAFAAVGKDLVLSTDEEQVELTRLIAAIKVGDLGPSIAEGMSALAAAQIARGADVIVAGCTEIPLVLPVGSVAVPLVSSTDVLAEATVATASTSSIRSA